MAQDKHTKDKDISIKDKMVVSMLTLASERSWDFVDFEDIMEHAGVDLQDAREHFDDRTDILIAYGRMLDRRMIEQCEFGEDDDISCREKIFDLLMERFDIVNEDRDAILSILHGFKGDPKKVTGLTGIYLYALKTWKEDESPDMAKTMSTLDKALDKAEMIWNSLPIKK